MPSSFGLKKGLALPVIVALSFVLGPFEPQAWAQVNKSGEDEVGAKSLKIPNKTPEATPCLSWLENGKEPKVAVLCIHGLGLHKGTYDGFGKALSKAGAAVYAIDMRGFGLRKTEQSADFEGSLADIKYTLEFIKKDRPKLPIVILGESMGGAIALRAAALYPNLISGLISSVPSGERFNSGDVSAKIALHGIFGGFNKPVKLDKMVVDAATQKQDLRDAWENDPLAVTELSPNQLMAFSAFMKQNFEAARTIKDTPVLFIQGANDKLVRPAGTWRLCESLATPNRQMVLSKSSEHLIFEENQFSKEDLSFVCSWIDKNVARLDASVVASVKEQPAVASANLEDNKDSTNMIASSSGSTSARAGQTNASSTGTSQPAPSKEDRQAFLASAQPVRTKNTASIEGPASGINYWIELNRSGKIYRCNNKIAFQSGDAIRFHIIPESDGYAYVVMKAGTTGKSAVLFPSQTSGTNNHLARGQDYPLPSKRWLQFDANPGTEKVSLVFSKKQIDIAPDGGNPQYLTAYVASGTEGSKDLVPTRMQLTWDDPNPVIIPDNFSGNSQLAMGDRSGRTSLVRLISSNPGGVMAVEISLDHK